MPPVAVAQQGQQAASSSEEKTRAEIDKLEAETRKAERDNGFWGRLPAFGALAAAIVALFTLLGTLRKQQADAKTERDKNREERARERVRRFDEQFTAMVERICSTNNAERASAAASIRAFLKEEHREFHEQVVSLLGANLKFPQGNETDRVIERVFAHALRLNRERLSEVLGGTPLDLNKAQLRRVDLSGLTLDGCDMFAAKLHGIDLTGSSLRDARGLEVDLSAAVLVRANLEEARLKEANLRKARLGGARLVSTKLPGADAQSASFDDAKMQEANLDAADVRGATFRGADLNNAFFREARFDDSALRSIVRAENWRKANFDEETLARLKALGTP